jgi:hypothetical protein
MRVSIDTRQENGVSNRKMGGKKASKQAGKQRELERAKRERRRRNLFFPFSSSPSFSSSSRRQPAPELRHADLLVHRRRPPRVARGPSAELFRVVDVFDVLQHARVGGDRRAGPVGAAGLRGAEGD